MRTILTAVFGAVLVTACAAPSTRIADGLQRYGVDARQAACVGERLQRDLSLGQLQQLGRAAAAYRKGDDDPGRLTTDDLLRVAGQIKDPAIIFAVGKAGAGCGVVP